MSDKQEILRFATASETEAAIDFAWSGHPVEDGVGLALSGGGYRAMLFHVGALVRLNELGLLAGARRIASVSGGSIAAGLLAADWRGYGQPKDGVLPHLAESLVPRALALSKASIDVGNVLTGWLPFVTAAGALAKSYDDLIFKGRTLQNLPDDAPIFVFCATNLATGAMWRFTKAYAGDWLVGRIRDPQFPLATAVAASSAFPPVLSPLELDVSRCTFEDWSTIGTKRPFDPAPFRKKILLTDGGVYDNHGLEPIVKRYSTLFVSDAGAPFERTPEVHTDLVNQPLRVFAIADGQSRALRRRDLIDRYVRGKAAAKNGVVPKAALDDGARLGAYWAIDTDPAKLPAPDAIDIADDEIRRLAAVRTMLSDPGEATARALIDWGYAIADRSLRINYVGKLPNVPAKRPA